MASRLEGGDDSRAAPEDETPRHPLGILTLAFKVAVVSLVTMGMLMAALSITSYRSTRKALHREIDLMGATLAQALTLPDVTTWEPDHGSVADVAGRVCDYAVEFGTYLDAMYGLQIHPVEHKRRGSQRLVKDLSPLAVEQQERVLALHENLRSHGELRLRPLVESGGTHKGRVLDAFILRADHSGSLVRANADGRTFRAQGEERPFLAVEDDPATATQTIIRDGSIDSAGAARSYAHPIFAADGTITHHAFVFLSAEHINAQLRSLLTSNLLFAALFALMGGGICHFLASRLTRPISALIDEAEEIRRGAAPHPTHVRTHDEVGLLAQTMDAMVRRLDESRAQATAELASEVHRKQVPIAVPYLPGFTVDVLDQLTSKVGGTYYDFPELPGKGLAMVVAQSSTTGIAAAMNVIQAGILLRSKVSESKDPRELLAAINGPLHDSLHAEMHVALSVAILEPRERRVVVGSAGRLPVLIYRARTGKAEAIELSGEALGVTTTERFRNRVETYALELEPGDRVLLGNGGVEALCDVKNNTLGREAWTTLIEQACRQPPDRFIAEIRRSLRQFLGAAKVEHDVVVVSLRASSDDSAA